MTINDIPIVISYKSVGEEPLYNQGFSHFKDMSSERRKEKTEINYRCESEFFDEILKGE